MKIAYLSHSLIAERQQIFAAELRKQLEGRGGELLEIYPAKWGRHQRDGGYHVSREGDQMSFTYEQRAWQALRDWKPDVVLLQQEPYCVSSYQASLFCKRLGIPYVVFTWENLNHPQGEGLGVLQGAAGIVCGNSDARRLVSDTIGGWSGVHGILPQVGIDPTIFSPSQDRDDTLPEYDILFNGRRNDPMKGEGVLDQAATAWKVAKGYQLGFADYYALGKRYANAKIQCTPSLDVPGRPREQFAPATSIEGLLSGVPLVTTNQAAIHEWLSGCPGVWFAKQGDAQSLKESLTSALVDCTQDGLRRRGRQGREWCLERFSNAAVAAHYVKVFQKVLQ